MLISRHAIRPAVKLKLTAEVASTAAQASRTSCIDNGSTGLARLGGLERRRWNRRWLLVDGAVTVASLATQATVYSLVLNLIENNLVIGPGFDIDGVKLFRSRLTEFLGPE